MTRIYECLALAAHQGRPRFEVHRTIFAVVCFLVFLNHPAQCVSPDALLSQYAHSAWRMRDGFFSGAPTAIAQTKDGVLWMGTANGLFQFDGIHFSRWNGGQQELQYLDIHSLLGAGDGTLWIGGGAGLFRWDGQRVRRYAMSRARVNEIVQDHKGNIWVARSRVQDWSGPLCQVIDGRLRCYGVRDGIPIPYATSLTEDSSGAFWLAGATTLVKWMANQSQQFQVEKLRPTEGLAGAFSAIVAESTTSYWVGINKAGKELGLQRLIKGRWKPFSTKRFDGSRFAVSTLFADSQHALWIGTSRGIVRVYRGRVNQFDASDGLSSDMVLCFFEDHEGSIWVATSRGVDVFRSLPVRTFSTREGLSSDTVSSVLTAHDGTVWIGARGALHFIRNDTMSSIDSRRGLPGDKVTCLLQDRAGTLWVGVDNGLFILRNDRFVPISDPSGRPLGIVYTLSEDNDGIIWTTTYSPPPHRKLFRIQAFRASDETAAIPIQETISISADAAGGGIWASLFNGNLLRYQRRHVERVPIEPIAHVGALYTLANRPNGELWGAGPNGVVCLRNGVTRSLTNSNGLPCDGVYAVLFDKSLALWLYTQCGLISISKDQLANWWRDPRSKVGFRRFDESDGVQPGEASFRPNAASSSDGRLWFVNDRTVQVIDPFHLPQNAIPPPVTIQTVVADTKAYSPADPVQLPQRTREIQVNYTAFSYVAPERVRFRYKLIRYDKNWQDAGVRRSAFYMNLPPGNYEFQVIACNNDGVWNHIGAVVKWFIPPAWYQTLSFAILISALSLALVVLFYRFKLRQASALLRTRFDERLEERTRLARDLHDTLIQTIQGSKLVADDARDSSADPERMRTAIGLLSTWLGRALEEGRAALSSLRSATINPNDLADAFQRVGEECQIGSAIRVIVTARGPVQEVQPLVKDEIYRLGYEAISNACVHSGGSLVSVDLSYGRDFRLSINDDGHGMDTHTVTVGKPGHYGLQGMRERASDIGAALTIVSSPTGTKITLTVPGKVMYRELRPRKT
jgi:signal transduction histidine kinase/ligand-binding sensor domain-containing protein